MVVKLHELIMSAFLEISGQLHATAALPLQTQPLAPQHLTASLYVVEKRNTLTLPKIKPQSLTQPITSHVTNSANLAHGCTQQSRMKICDFKMIKEAFTLFRYLHRKTNLTGKHVNMENDIMHLPSSSTHFMVKT
jgi:hypothetical protein